MSPVLPAGASASGGGGARKAGSEQREIDLEAREARATARELAADRRDRHADERDRRADERDRLADERDRHADERGRAADERDRAADQREIHEEMRASEFVDSGEVRRRPRGLPRDVPSIFRWSTDIHERAAVLHENAASYFQAHGQLRQASRERRLAREQADRAHRRRELLVEEERQAR